MKIDISEYEKVYSFELLPVTQLCGQNIRKKTYIFESLRRYFSTFKYLEEKNKWRDNVKIDNEIVGRKYFSMISIKEASDIIQMIKWSKQSLMMEYVKNLIQRFDWQLHLRTVSEEVEEMFQLLNEDISKLGDIELAFTMSEVWDMVQKSNVTGGNDTVLEDKDNCELLNILLKLIVEVLCYSPRKMLVLIENMDHMVTEKEYKDILEQAQKISGKYDIYFVLSTSLEGYAVCSEELCPGITVFGEADFQMPEFDDVYKFVKDNYPYEKNLSREQLPQVLTRIIQKIGQQEYLYSVEERVICKMINQSLLLYDKWQDSEKTSEIAFLKS